MPETEFKYDVFISYSHKDEGWVVKTLLPALENAGLAVCIDYRDFDAGKPSIVNMEDAVDESRHTVLVLTPNWTGSEWTDFEAVLTQTDDPVGRHQKMIPIMLEKCDPPKRVKSLTYVDFMRADRLDNAWTQLFKALGRPETFKPSNVQPDNREAWHLAHPYPMPPNFTGRATELKMLDDWLADNTNRLFILRALGGFGKSALTWQWINTHVDPAKWTKLVWWSFYEGDASFEHFIEETLKYLKLDVPQGQRPQVDALLKAMQSQKILLIMDGFERALRLYANMNAAYQSEEEQKIEDAQLDCVNINAEFFLKGVCSLPNIKSKVLMTSRLTPRSVKRHDEFLQGCVEKELKEMDKVDAVAFFHAQGIRGTHTEIETACAPYGYHPLSLRILTGLIVNDRQIPGNIGVAESLDITDDIIQNKNHVLKVAYDTLSFDQQILLSNIACLRSPTNYQVLKFISNKPSWKRRKNKHRVIEKLDDSLQALETRGLLHWDRNTNAYDLHPIVRRYAYERLTAPNRIMAHSRLRDYFATANKSIKPQTLDELSPIIELYHHTIQTGEIDNAYKILHDRLMTSLYYQLNAYGICIELTQALLVRGEGKSLPLSNESWQAWAESILANLYCLTGQPHRAIPLYENVIDISARNDAYNSKINLGMGLGSLAQTVQIPTGALVQAERNLKLRIELGQELGENWTVDNGLRELALLLAIRGIIDESKKTIEEAITLAQKMNNVQNQGLAWAYRAIQFFIDARSNESRIELLNLAFASAQRALELADEDARKNVPVPVDHTRAYWLFGKAFRENHDLIKAYENLSRAIIICRQYNIVYFEADILLDLARLRYDQKNYEEAKSLADEALLITERCGYVLQGADVNLFLAQYTLEQEQHKAKAKAYAETALRLATCDGPPYYYKVAYEEAERFLENLK